MDKTTDFEGKRKLRVVWLTNCPLKATGRIGSGSWLDVVAADLIKSGRIELVSIYCQSDSNCGRSDENGIVQWGLPGLHTLAQSGEISASTLRNVRKILDEFRPSLINVWGTESGLGLLTARRLVKGSSLLTLQGVKYQIARKYNGEMTLQEQRAARGAWQIFRRISIGRAADAFRRYEHYEKEIFRGHKYFICQTPWQEAQVASNNQSAKIFRMDLPLRDTFDSIDNWNPSLRERTVFCSISYPTPFKGLHVAVRALYILKASFPMIRLRVAGIAPKAGWRSDGYLKWVESEISKLGLGDSVDWLGGLTAPQVAAELVKCSVAVLPTFIESYCVAFAEAMRAGTPTVVAYTGGTSYLGKDDETCLFFPSGDEASCAYQVRRILEDSSLARRISVNARKVAICRHDREAILAKTLAIYDEVAQKYP